MFVRLSLINNVCEGVFICMLVFEGVIVILLIWSYDLLKLLLNWLKLMSSWNFSVRLEIEFKVLDNIMLIE